MIIAKGVSKKFNDILAVDNIDATIKDGGVFGLIGTNGAGKSTFMRILSGVLRADTGSITIDDKEVFENVEVKSRFFYISDEQFFFSNATPEDMRAYYKSVYPKFENKRFTELMYNFGLNTKRKITTFSKGMKKQLSIILAISANTDYIFCDETFDGLDPVMRQAVKSIFASEIESRNLTPIIASHNLRELEDICDHVGLLHKGGILLSKDIDDMKINIHKIQCIFKGDGAINFDDVNPIKIEQRGSLYTITARGEREEISTKINAKNPIFMEVLPLSLEEIFISETEVVGYDIKKLIL